MKKILITVFGLFIVISNAYGAMFKCKMPDGSFQYSDRPCKKYTLKQEKTVPDFTGKKINIFFENADIRDVLKKVASHGGYAVTFHRYVTGTISVNYFKKPWDEIFYRISESQDLTAMPVSSNTIHVTPNQMRMSGGSSSKTPEEKYQKCIDICDQKFSTCRKLSDSVAYGNTRWGCRNDRYQCHKACRPGFSIY